MQLTPSTGIESFSGRRPGATVDIVAGIRLHRVQLTGGWYLVGAANACFVLGDAFVATIVRPADDMGPSTVAEANRAPVELDARIRWGCHSGECFPVSVPFSVSAKVLDRSPSRKFLISIAASAPLVRHS